MSTVVVDFDPVRITNFNLKFPEDEAAQPFGCVGKVDGETELLEIVKKCEGVEAKKISKPQKMTLKINGHIKVAALRKINGLSNTGLKTGVYSYGSNSISKEFCLTADVVDDFEEQTKVIAFPNCVSATGLTISVENGADEVAELELEFTAMADDNKNCYYEALLSELEDTTIATTWRTNFGYDLVKIATP